MAAPHPDQHASTAPPGKGEPSGTGAFLRPQRKTDDDRRKVGAVFDAELDICELDDRGRPGLTWTARATELSRSRLAFRSRRMCYVGRPVLIAVHLIDDQPVPLYGRISHCSYDNDARYRVEVELQHLPDQAEISQWLAAHKRR